MRNGIIPLGAVYIGDGIGVDELAAAVVAVAGGDPPSQAWLDVANEGSVRRRVTAWFDEASTRLGDAIA